VRPDELDFYSMVYGGAHRRSSRGILFHGDVNADGRMDICRANEVEWTKRPQSGGSWTYDHAVQAGLTCFSASQKDEAAVRASTVSGGASEAVLSALDVRATWHPDDAAQRPLLAAPVLPFFDASGATRFEPVDDAEHATNMRGSTRVKSTICMAYADVTGDATPECLGYQSGELFVGGLGRASLKAIREMTSGWNGEWNYHAMVAADFNQDGKLELILFGRHQMLHIHTSSTGYVSWPHRWGEFGNLVPSDLEEFESYLRRISGKAGATP